MTRVLDPKHVETSDLLNPCLRLDPNMACSQYSFHCMVEQDLGPDAEYLKQWKEQETEPVDMEVEVETIDAESSPAQVQLHQTINCFVQVPMGIFGIVIINHQSLKVLNGAFMKEPLSAPIRPPIAAPKPAAVDGATDCAANPREQLVLIEPWKKRI